MTLSCLGHGYYVLVLWNICILIGFQKATKYN